MDESRIELLNLRLEVNRLAFRVKLLEVKLLEELDPNFFRNPPAVDFNHCPFCGTADCHSARPQNSPAYRVLCNHCGATGPYADSKYAAHMGWNKRTHPTK